MSWGDDAEDSFNESFEFSDEDDGFNQSIELKQDCLVLGPQALAQQVQELVKDFAETIHVPSDVASMLLRLHKWNKEDLVSNFFENREKILETDHLSGYERIGEPFTAGETGSCLICNEDAIPAADLFALQCGHYFCKTCWQGYLDDKITEGSLAIRSHCPMFKCRVLIPDYTVRKLVSMPQYEKYRSGIARSFVEDSRNIRWCPGARCDKALKVYSSSVKNVKCRCGTRICFQCNEESHAPATCEQLDEWLEKCKNESETAHWIIANTRKCPKCFVRIEKNQGCNHLICRSCKYEFCWVCMGAWSDHGNHSGGFYKCNKYDPKKRKTVMDTIAKKGGGGGKLSAKELAAQKAEEAKAELDRYLHYYRRYHNHDQSKRIASSKASEIESRMSELQSKGNSAWIDVQFIKNAQDQVAACRSILKFTYVFGYYLEDGPEKELFEFLQQNLEKNTEYLAELTEQPLEAMHSTEIVNYSRITEKFMQNLLEGVENGLIQ